MAVAATKRTAEGWLIKYGMPSAPIKLPSGRSLTEIIQAGAFIASIDAINAGQAEIEANVEHVDDAICRIGLSGKNVVVQNRPEGVYATLQFLSDTISNDLFARIQAGIVTGLSVEFSPAPGIEAAYSVDADGNYVRTWTQLILTGFAITAGPAYPDSQIIKVTDGATFTRSLKSAEVAKIAAEIEAIEQARIAGRNAIYEHEKFLLGIR